MNNKDWHFRESGEPDETGSLWRSNGFSLMKLIPLTCNHCGAPLEVPRKARFATCEYCSSRLAVHHEGSAWTTEVVESIEKNTRDIAEDVDAIRLQNDIERLDREWMMERGNLMTRGKDGSLSVPSHAGTVIGSIVGVVFIVFWIGMAINIGAPVFFPAFGVVGLVIVIAQCFGGISKAEQYQRARHRYQRERRKLAERLHNHNP